MVPDRGSAQDRQARDLGITAFELMIDVAFTQRVWPLPLEAGGLERMLDRFCSLLKHLVQNGHGTLDATDVYEGVYGPGRAVSLRVLGSPGSNIARGLTVRPVLQHAQTAKYLLVLQRKFGILRAQGKTGWIPFDIGLMEQGPAIEFGVGSAKMMDRQAGVDLVSLTPSPGQEQVSGNYD